MQLIYRGYTYSVQPTVKTQSLHPPVINWRYRVAGTPDELVPVSQIDRCPRAINWRYQLAAMA